MLAELNRLEARQVVGGQGLEFEVSTKTCVKVPKNPVIEHETCVGGSVSGSTTRKKLVEKGREVAKSTARKAVEAGSCG